MHVPGAGIATDQFRPDERPVSDAAGCALIWPGRRDLGAADRLAVDLGQGYREMIAAVYFRRRGT